MMLRRFDRYLLRETIGPFGLALTGLVLFILLNVILSLSDLMVDRGIGMPTLLRLVVLKLPSLIVLAVPMAGLFAVFLALGRLSHDREIIALETIGISLRRILVPLLIAAVGVSVLDFAIYNWAVPASERAYQQALRGVIFRQGAPRITANAFFRGPNDQFFYIRRYDERDGSLHDVHVYDTTGRLFPQAQAAVTMITAETGTWSGRAWELVGGRVYGFDRDGGLIYSGRFDRLEIPVDQGVEEVLIRSRTPAEMGIGELRTRIEQARANGQRIDEYIVEAHLKLALPLATVVFVLLGGAVSLMFGPRSRATGIVLGLVMVAVFQGVLWWTQTLGRRGVIDPALAAWLPNLVFGIVGLGLFFRLDRLAARGLWGRARAALPFLGVLVALGVGGGGRELPMEVRCDELFVADDGSEVRAIGGVRATYDATSFSADALVLVRGDDGDWSLEATGGVRYADRELTVNGDRITATLAVVDGSVRTTAVGAEEFSGESRFVNSAGRAETLYFRGGTAQVRFDETGAPERVDADRADVTTCNCCGVGLIGQPYSVHARRIILYPERLLVAFDVVARVGGVGVLWLPVYVRPLQETLDSPLFPAFGRSSLRGWFLKWNLPVYWSETLYGSVLIDYFHRYGELGLGGVIHYVIGGESGRVSVYSFPAKVGDPVRRVSVDQAIDLGSGWSGSGAFRYEAVGTSREWSFSARVGGELGAWRTALTASRGWAEGDSEARRITERIPELALRRDPLGIGGILLEPSFALGWYREWDDDEPKEAALRASGSVRIDAGTLKAAGWQMEPTATVGWSRYIGSDGIVDVMTAGASIRARRDGASISYALGLASGASPFEFDRSEMTHRITWRLGRQSGPVSARLDGGVRLVDGRLEPVYGVVEWRGPVNLSAEAKVDAESGSVEALTVRGRWSDERWETSWTVPYHPQDGALGRVVLAAAASGRAGRVALRGAAAPGDPLAVSLEAELTLLAGLGVSAGGTYEIAVGTISDPYFGGFWEIGGCIRIGVERRSGETWVYASVLAFPEAAVRYAPESAKLALGEGS